MQKLKPIQIGEFDSRDFLGEETWKRWKASYDECMAFRKTIKGKPTDEQRFQLEVNAMFIEFYGSVLFHSVRLAQANNNPGGLCPCTSCGRKRTTAGVK